MIRMSSLPSSQYCSMVSKIGQNIESINALRSTAFHSYCERGEWPEDIVRRLPTEDFAEVSKWKKPKPLGIDVELEGDKQFWVLNYSVAIKECRVGLNKQLEWLEIPRDVPQEKIEELYPQCLASGHVDMYWEQDDIIVVEDIKSSIFAVSDRCNSLQLHAYGLALCKKHGKTKYIPCIWDASEGKHYVGKVVDINGFDFIDIESRIINAAANNGSVFTTGSHCSSCWKRTNCPAHMVNLDADSPFKPLFDGTVTPKDVRNALIQIKRIKDSADKAERACKDYIRQHGPVESEDGSKIYCVALREGRKSLDTESIMRDLKVDDETFNQRYMKRSDEFEVWGWRNVPK